MATGTSSGRPVENDETGACGVVQSTEACEVVPDNGTSSRGPICQDLRPHEPVHKRVDRAKSFNTPCSADCDYMSTEKKNYFGGKLQEFWESIPESPNACYHWKSWENVKEAIKTRYAKLKSVTIQGLQKLLCPDLNQNESTLLVKLENFLKLVKCFGPFGETNGQCYTLTQFEKFLTQSARKIGTSKISWFAGDISREQAEVYLEGQRKGTYLLRLSQSEFGAFALSVVAVEGEPPLHVMFKFEKDSGDSAEYIWFNRKHYSALKVIEYCQRKLFDDDYRDLRCRYECPNLPFNSIVTGYRGRNK